MTARSPADNVLLEYRLALELKERAFIEKIYPVFIGDVIEGSKACERGNYFDQGCHVDVSTLSDVVVDAIESKLRTHLSRECLGSPMSNEMTIKALLVGITVNQGGFVEGREKEAFQKINNDLISVVSELDHR